MKCPRKEASQLQSPHFVDGKREAWRDSSVPLRSHCRYLANLWLQCQSSHLPFVPHTLICLPVPSQQGPWKLEAEGKLQELPSETLQRGPYRSLFHSCASLQVQPFYLPLKCGSPYHPISNFTPFFLLYKRGKKSVGKTVFSNLFAGTEGFITRKIHPHPTQAHTPRESSEEGLSEP